MSLNAANVIGHSHYGGVELQITDLALAHTFLDRAATAFDGVAMRRLQAEPDDF